MKNEEILKLVSPNEEEIKSYVETEKLGSLLTDDEIHDSGVDHLINSDIVRELKRVVYNNGMFYLPEFREYLRELGIFSHA